MKFNVIFFKENRLCTGLIPLKMLEFPYHSNEKERFLRSLDFCLRRQPLFLPLLIGKLQNCSLLPYGYQEKCHCHRHRTAFQYVGSMNYWFRNLKNNELILEKI